MGDGGTQPTRDHDSGVGARRPARGSLHHVELQVRDLDRALAAWGWILGELGYREDARWSDGASLRLGDAYVVIARAPRDAAHDRRGAGLSHLAFHAGSAADVDRLWDAAPDHGWARLYADRHPFAGGPDHRAAFLEDAERFKVELVAADDPAARLPPPAAAAASRESIPRRPARYRERRPAVRFRNTGNTLPWGVRTLRG